MIIVCSHVACEEPYKKLKKMLYCVKYIVLSCYSACYCGRCSLRRTCNPVHYLRSVPLITTPSPLPPQTVHNSWIRTNSLSYLLLDLLSMNLFNSLLLLQILSASIVSCSNQFKKFTKYCVKKCYLKCFKLILYYFNDCLLAPVLWDCVLNSACLSLLWFC